MASPASTAEARRLLASVSWQTAKTEAGTPISRISISAMNSIDHRKTAEYYKGALDALGINSEIKKSKSLGLTVRITGHDDIKKLHDAIQAHKILEAARSAEAQQRNAAQEKLRAEQEARLKQANEGKGPRMIRNSGGKLDIIAPGHPDYQRNLRAAETLAASSSAYKAIGTAERIAASLKGRGLIGVIAAVAATVVGGSLYAASKGSEPAPGTPHAASPGPAADPAKSTQQSAWPKSATTLSAKPPKPGLTPRAH